MDDCVVCLEMIDPALPDYTRMALQCGHWFHTRCIAQWLIQSHSCPQCRRVIHAAGDEVAQRSQLRHAIHHYEIATDISYNAWYIHLLCQCARLLFPECLNAAYFHGALDLNAVFRLILCMNTGVALANDCVAYDAELASPAMTKYLKVLRGCLFLRFLVLVGHTLFDCCSRNTGFARHALLFIVPVDFALQTVTLGAAWLAQADFKRHVSVEITYTTIE